jgi:hypothetical protein
MKSNYPLNIASLEHSNTKSGSTLPFDSKYYPERPSEVTTNRSSSKNLNPPKPLNGEILLLEDATQEIWTQYGLNFAVRGQLNYVQIQYA